MKKKAGEILLGVKVTWVEVVGLTWNTSYIHNIHNY